MRASAQNFAIARSMAAAMAHTPPCLIIVLCGFPLIWPALWNGYPIVFADTGTYLSQAMHRYLGWDRPIFYSFFILPLHLGRSVWPVIVAQSGLTLLVLDLTRRAFELPPRWLAGITLVLTSCSWLPWMVSELMPDLFTPLLVLLLSLLVFTPARFGLKTRCGMTALAAFMIATQQSSVLLSAGLLALVIPGRWLVSRLWHQRIPGRTLMPAFAPLAAASALILVNVIGHHRVAISPFGNVFVLARVIYDGPGMDVLRRDCPGAGWRLCPYLDRFPAISDAFLWDKTSPILLAGGHKAVSADADAIIHRAILAEPAQILSAAVGNAITQLSAFASGDGLEPWPDQVSEWIDRDFPAAERSRYHAARQQDGDLNIPAPLAALHRAAALTGIVAATGLSVLAWRRRDPVFLFLMLGLATLPLSATITGALSTPHDRYQSRVVWLPGLLALLSAPGLCTPRVPRGGRAV